jgi:hypothetical protein
MGLIGTAGFALVLDYLALVVHFLGGKNFDVVRST